MRFELSSIPEVGRLLAALVAQRPRGRFGEVGSGCGVGTAWIASALGPEAALVTVEAEEERAAAVSRLFEGDSQVRVLPGDWHEVLLPRGRSTCSSSTAGTGRAATSSPRARRPSR
jgi:predicted O-methyltransferase YrrM